MQPPVNFLSGLTEWETDNDMEGFIERALVEAQLERVVDLDHDRRRKLDHRAKNCECFDCFRELRGLPPPGNSRGKDQVVSVRETFD